MESPGAKSTGAQSAPKLMLESATDSGVRVLACTRGSSLRPAPRCRYHARLTDSETDPDHKVTPCGKCLSTSLPLRQRERVFEVRPSLKRNSLNPELELKP